MTAAMEAFYWMEEKSKNCQVLNGNEMNVDIFASKKGISQILDVLEEDEFQNMVQNIFVANIDLILESDESLKESKDFQERRNFVVNLIFAIFDEFLTEGN